MMAEMELGQQIRAARETLLRSLKFETMNERRNSIADSDRDTSTWALDDGVGLPHHCFLDWLRSIDQKLFWINGKAGSGKSTLMKFLIRNPRTVEILSSANPRPIILSHFIWMAGQASERSLKGVYCSLLYQLLSADENLASLVLEKYPQLAQKDFHSDWEQLELDDGFFYAIGATLRPVCIFLDGLDEVDPADGQSRVLQLIGRFCAVGQVKVCVASRPEPVLRRQLCHCPMMRLQDLTKSDIRNHATNVLNPHITPQEKGFSEFLDRICEKADGVFLWVSLALKSLKSGIENGDSLEELQLRLDALPKDLQQLYSQMWRRLNDDEPIYRRDAALYFNLVLDFHLFEDKETITLFHILLASDAALAEQLIHDPETMSEKQFQQRCEGLSKRLEVRCAGVLEVTADVAQRVTFIHRSAREFLLNTPEGQQITQYDTSSSEARLFNLAAGDMALLRLRLGPAKFGIFEQFQYRRAVGYGLGYVTHDWNHVQGCVSRLQRLSHFKSVPATKTVELGRFCEEIYHTWRMGTTRLQKLDFLGIAALIGLVEFVRAAVVGLLGKSPDGHLSPPYESYLLRAAGFKIFDTNIHIIKGKEQLVTWLVSQGMISSLHLPAPFRERREVSAIGTLGTPATAILEDAVEYPYNTSVAILDHLAAIVRYNNSLEECVIISLFQFKDQFRISFDPDPNSREAGYFLLVQVNVAFLIDLYLKSMSRDCSASLGGRTLLQPTSQDAVRPESVLLGFSWFPEAEISSDGFNSGFNWDSNSSILLAPATKRDSDYALSAFAKAHLRDRDNYWIIPELEERLKIIEPRACITMARDMFEDLLSKGLMHRADNLENWPPKPF
jgi:hypothetical protein